MGQFSYMCKGCKTSIRSSEFCIIFYIEGGNIMEVAQDYYDNYGLSEYFEPQDKGASAQQREWERKVNVHFDKDKSSGFQGWHGACLIKRKVNRDRTVSQDDPEQGWEKPRERFESEVVIPYRLLKIEKLGPKVSEAELMVGAMLNSPDLKKKKLDPHSVYLVDRAKDLIKRLRKEREVAR